MSSAKRLGSEEGRLPMAYKRAKPAAGPLDGFRVFVSRAGITEARAELLANIASRLGARASTQISELSSSVGSLVVVTSPNQTREALRTRLAGMDTDSLTIV
eukprot:CAMPEP_0118953924 /NCGR_PEP_ID=MMETSP1169-20130426/57385_1 /TAXON_ID=36882 /ORGANISM="Pyramimonas obovata, Strain CCMP722" /LENGTH=101 /DNA_ID=CAMNT_0006901475 /DNA_START=414 /DNA_END=716 /DNA_ORIENTATION=+